MNLPKLSPRLKKAAELVPQCNTFLDVGTDHAYLPVYLINSGICKVAIASDLREGPLKRAKETAELFCADGKISLRLGSGFETVCKNEAETAAVCGMGGILIAELLKTSEAIAKSLKALVLQPMTAIFELREFLYKNGYTVEEEQLVKEDEKLYHILKVTPHKDASEKSFAQLYFGDKIKKDSPYFEEYKLRTLKKLETKLFGMEKSVCPDEKTKKIINETKLLINRIKSI